MPIAMRTLSATISPAHKQRYEILLRAADAIGTRSDCDTELGEDGGDKGWALR
jgi:hypothetical protein